MPSFNLSLYDFDPFGVFSQTLNGTTTYTGSGSVDGTAVVTDNGTGLDGLTLEDNTSGETATADIFINGVLDTGADVSAEETWTLVDTVTGQTFQLATFHIENGANAGYYTLSEVPLVPGRTYRTIDFDSTPDASAGDPVFAYADNEFADGIVEGTSGDDVIDGGYSGDPEGDVVDGNDAFGVGPPTPLQFNWTDYADETNLAGGVSQNTGGIQVDVSLSAPAGNEFSAEHSGPKYREAGEPFNSNSSAYLYQNGSSTDANVTVDFSSSTGSGFEDTVENVQFRINDIDGVINTANNFQDILTITAFDADGNEVPVNITISGDDGLSNQTVTAAISNNNEAQANGSILVEIPGPVAQIIINYDNGGDTQQAVYLSDIHFDAVPLGSNDDVIQAGAGNDIVDGQYGDDELYGEAGDDTLTGGSGSDILDGGTGNDTLNVGSGDTATGGDGDDTFVIDDTVLGGGTISITGGEGDETTGDTLDFNGQLAPGSVVISNSDDNAGGLSGTATLLDGTVVNFSEIESIICFAEGTLIETLLGPCPIEDIQVGDQVICRDRGPMAVRWHGSRAVPAKGDLAPIRFAPGAVGNTRPLLVSPQHRMLVTDHRAQLYFGESEILVPAKALINGRDVVVAEAEMVTYHHLLFDWHAILTAEGAAAESYHPGAYSLEGLHDQAREELFEVFPALRSDPSIYGAMARMTVSVKAGSVLAA